MCHLSIFFFVACCFGVTSKMSLSNPNPVSYVLFYDFYNFSFSLIVVFDPLWLNFYIWHKVRINSTLLHVNIQFFHTICWKNLSFPSMNGLGILTENQLIISYFWALYSIPLVYMYVNIYIVPLQYYLIMISYYVFNVLSVIYVIYIYSHCSTVWLWSVIMFWNQGV